MAPPPWRESASPARTRSPAPTLPTGRSRTCRPPRPRGRQRSMPRRRPIAIPMYGIRIRNPHTCGADAAMTAENTIRVGNPLPADPVAESPEHHRFQDVQQHQQQGTENQSDDESPAGDPVDQQHNSVAEHDRNAGQDVPYPDGQQDGIRVRPDPCRVPRGRACTSG